MCKKIVLLFCLIILTNACDEPTFANVSVTVVGARGVNKISGCLEPDGTLEKASYIQIINETVPALHRGAIQNLHNLMDVILESNGITEIDPGAFNNLPKLRLLRLTDNKISTIRNNVFSQLTVSELNLMRNEIETIETHAFDNMPMLSLINLDNNKIAIWNSNWFYGASNLNTISVKNNLLVSIPAEAFKNVNGFHVINGKNVSTNIYLDENRIRNLDPHALKGLDTLGWLFLTKNSIRHIDANFLQPLKTIDWLKLSQNELDCVPDEIFNKISSVAHYMDGNPLSSDWCEVVVSGKLRGQRAKSMKFVDGLMIHSGDPCNDYVDTATRHVLLRQGVLGIKVKIMLPWDPNGKIGPKRPLPDNVSVVEPKEETLPLYPMSDIKPIKPDAPPVAVAVA